VTTRILILAVIFTLFGWDGANSQENTGAESKKPIDEFMGIPWGSSIARCQRLMVEKGWRLHEKYGLPGPPPSTSLVFTGNKYYYRFIINKITLIGSDELGGVFSANISFANNDKSTYEALISVLSKEWGNPTETEPLKQGEFAHGELTKWKDKAGNRAVLTFLVFAGIPLLQLPGRSSVELFLVPR
jgi:hypothetical protein